MKKYFLFLFLSVLFPQYTNLDLLYYTYDEIVDQLLLWESEFGPNNTYGNPAVCDLIKIGESTNEGLPIYALKLSVNADQDQDEARVLILGQCHAEEIYGVEMSMSLIDWLLHPEETPWGNSELPIFMNNLEIWVVPTHNPEGLNVVHGYCDNDFETIAECEEYSGNWIQDISYRKNKTDVNGDGIFNYVPFYPNEVSGEDEDGVDLNRNYDLNWIHGDTWKINHSMGCNANQGYESNYDYYRGSEPFSEKEIRAIRDLVIEKQFLLSIAYHSSRSGCISERVVFPWAWGWEDDNGNEIVDNEEAKISPDFDIIQQLATNVAYLIHKEGSGYYNPRPQKSINGNAHDWIYAETGCIQLLIEMGSSTIQPLEDEDAQAIGDYNSDDTIDAQDLIDQTIENNRKGLFYLLREAVASEAIDTRHISGVVTDAVSGFILDSVEVRALAFHGDVLKPRLTDTFGRYRRLLPLGDYTLEFIAEGYKSQVINTGFGSKADLNIELIPLDQYEITFILDNPENFSESVAIELFDSSGYNNTFNLVVEPITRPLFNQEYSLLAYGNSIVPYTSTLSITSTDTVYLNLENKNSILDDFVESSNWISLDTWQVGGGKLISQNEELYSSDLQSITRLENVLQVTADTVVAIEINLAYELEWEKDTAYFNIISVDSMIQVAQWTNQNWVIHPEFYFVKLKAGVSYGLEFGIISDETLGYRGVEIQDLFFYESSADLLDKKYILPRTYLLHQNYPNPFNPITTMKITMPIAGDMQVEIYNLLGRSVATLTNGYKVAGTYTLVWDASDDASGLYFVKAQADGYTSTKKLMLLK